MEHPVVVLVTVPSRTEGERIARQLVESKLAACVNILPHLYSIYVWQGKIEEEGELLLIIKTMPDRLSAVIERVKALHSYEVPEVLALPVVAGNEDYIRWVWESTRGHE